MDRFDLFLRASELRDYQVDTNFTFTGLVYTNTILNPPDTMGAIGPDHFIELLNGSDLSTASIAVYTRNGNLVSSARSIDFFALTNGETVFPKTRRLFDRRVLFDHQGQRWLATAFETNFVLIAVSQTANPTNLLSGWTRYAFQLADDGNSVDFPTLGFDDNGIYITAARKLGTSSGLDLGHSVIALKKPEIYQGTLVRKSFEITTNDPVAVHTIQPAINFDTVSTSGYAWFIGKGPPDTGTNYQGGAMFYRRLQWSGTNAIFDTNWFLLTNGVQAYRDYYDVETNLPSFKAPQATGEGGADIAIQASGRPVASVIRSGFLWTAHGVCLTGTNGTYTGDASGAAVDRSGIQWYRLRLEEGLLSYAEHGRIYDRGNTSTNCYWFYYPSLMANCARDAMVAFSGSGHTNYIGAFYTWRLAGGAMVATPRLIRNGRSAVVEINRWGDYSATTLDPIDDWSFWTVQEYNGGIPPELDTPNWETVVARIRPEP